MSRGTWGRSGPSFPVRLKNPVRTEIPEFPMICLFTNTCNGFPWTLGELELPDVVVVPPIPWKVDVGGGGAVGTYGATGSINHPGVLALALRLIIKTHNS